MNKFAIYQARTRLADARAAIDAMREAQNPTAFQRSWFAYLQAANGIFVKLQKGAQNNDKSMGYWGRLKHRRKTDELLAYLHQARRVEEHGLAFSTGLNSTEAEPVPDGYVTPDERRGKEIIADLGEAGRVRLTPPNKLILKDVVDDQYGDTYPLPKSHNGAPLVLPRSIPDFAEIALPALEAIIDEAATYVPLGQHMPSRDTRRPKSGANR